MFDRMFLHNGNVHTTHTTKYACKISKTYDFTGTRTSSHKIIVKKADDMIGVSNNAKDMMGGRKLEALCH